MTIIHSTPRQFSYVVKCSYCHTKYETNETFSYCKGYSTMCPICLRSNWRPYPKGNPVKGA